MTFYASDEKPLIQYEVSFPKKPLLLGEGSAGRETGDSGGTHVGVTEVLDDRIEWEPHVDKADKLDYIVAASGGVLAGLIDAFYVGEFSLDRATEWGKDKVNRFVIKAARAEGYKGDTLSGAIKALEKNHPFAADGNANDFGGGLQHHLRDFSHHFSISGIFFSIFTQFAGLVVGTDKEGRLCIASVPESHHAYIGKNFQEKIAFGVIGWFFHMLSDMAGSSGSLMGGTGIPGPLVSLMKEFSALPFFKNSSDGDMGFRLWVSKSFNGTLFADYDEKGEIIKGSARKFDLRSEIGVLEEAGRQTIPVLVNQCVVRGFYFCRRTLREIRDLDIKNTKELGRIAIEDVLPWGTPAMRRMISVSSGVFIGVDIADAAVRAAKKREIAEFFLRVNYVGVATFVIACVVDVRTSFEDKRGEGAEYLYERNLFDLNHFKLDFEKARILHSLMYRMVDYDIVLEKHDKRKARKRAWLEEWRALTIDTVGLAWSIDTGYFLDDEKIYETISRFTGDDDSWVWLVVMEASRFKPYAPLPDSGKQKYKGLKIGSDYLGDVLCERCSVVTKKELAKLNKSVDSGRSALDGSAPRRIVGGAGVVVAIATTGGLAFYFAPAIAPALAASLGANTAALSGAALTSASLAFLGGGALAAGGAGMAGGTMLIVGGGSLLGAVGGSGLSAVASMTLTTGSSHVLDECAKLVAFCEEVLIGRYGDFTSVAEVHDALNQRIIELDVEIEMVKRGIAAEDSSVDNDESAEKDEISPKKMLKILKRSQKFLKRSSNRIARTIEMKGRKNRKKKAASSEAMHV